MYTKRFFSNLRPTFHFRWEFVKHFQDSDEYSSFGNLAYSIPGLIDLLHCSRPVDNVLFKFNQATRRPRRHASDKGGPDWNPIIENLLFGSKPRGKFNFLLPSNARVILFRVTRGLPFRGFANTARCKNKVHTCGDDSARTIDGAFSGFQSLLHWK